MCCIMYTFGVFSLNCGAIMKAKPTIAMAALCTTTEATIAEGPRRGSGCTENRVIVREDLIRLMDPSLAGWPVPTLHAKRVFELSKFVPQDTPILEDARVTRPGLSELASRDDYEAQS